MWIIFSKKTTHTNSYASVKVKNSHQADYKRVRVKERILTEEGLLLLYLFIFSSYSLALHSLTTDINFSINGHLVEQRCDFERFSFVEKNYLPATNSHLNATFPSNLLFQLNYLFIFQATYQLL